MNLGVKKGCKRRKRRVREERDSSINFLLVF
jgi:hypothetical protein